MISIVIPFCDGWDFTRRAIELLAKNTEYPAQLVLIDQGSDRNYEPEAEILVRGSRLELKYIRLFRNTGVLSTFKIGWEESLGEIICFFHNDVLIHDKGWDSKVLEAFAKDPKLGLAGLFGASKVHSNGGRENSMSAMLGREWGGCMCHDRAALHHGNLIESIQPAAVFDGVGLFFRSYVLTELVENSDMFAEWRAPHHFYDRIFSLKVLDLGYHMAVLPIGFDHYSGATANHSDKYVEFGEKWLEEHGYPQGDKGVDNAIYALADQQWQKEFAHRCPVGVNENYEVHWS